LEEQTPRHHDPTHFSITGKHNFEELNATPLGWGG